MWNGISSFRRNFRGFQVERRATCTGIPNTSYNTKSSASTFPFRREREKKSPNCIDACQIARSETLHSRVDSLIISNLRFQPPNFNLQSEWKSSIQSYIHSFSLHRNRFLRRTKRNCNIKINYRDKDTGKWALNFAELAHSFWLFMTIVFSHFNTFSFFLFGSLMVPCAPFKKTKSWAEIADKIQLSNDKNKKTFPINLYFASSSWASNVIKIHLWTFDTCNEIQLSKDWLSH